MEDRIRREFEHGSMSGTTWKYEGIQLGYAKSVFTRPGSFPSNVNENDVVRLHFGMRGDYRFTYHQLNKRFDLIGGHHNIMYSLPFSMVVENKTLEIETFGIQYPREIFLRFVSDSDDLLKRFSESILAGKACMLSEQWGSIDPGLQLAIQQIIHCSYSGEVKQQFLLSKSIELLMLSAESCSIASIKKEPFIKSKSDKEKIIAVRDLVNERAHRPPNLTEISREIGINEYKLKRGFKEIFHTTVFGYLTEQRLHLAQRYLLDTDKAAADIAQELGYATAQHFNNAFKKKFGVTPLSLRK